METATLWEEIVDALGAVNGGPHPGYRAVHAKGTICTGNLHGDPRGEGAVAGGTSARGPGRGHDPLLERERPPPDPGCRSTRRPRNGGQVPPPRRRGHRHRLGAARRLSCPHARRLPGADPRPDPGPGDRSARPREAGRLPRPPTPRLGVALQKGLPKLAPTASYATSDYRALHAFCLVDADGGRHWGRYSWEPEAGTEYLSEEQRGSADRDYLQKEIRDRLAEGIADFTLEFTLANDGDSLDDPTVEWEGEHDVVELGELEVLQVVEDAETPGNPIVFDPMRLTDGIEPSDDKILAARPMAYSVSIERRTAS